MNDNKHVVEARLNALVSLSESIVKPSDFLLYLHILFFSVPYIHILTVDVNKPNVLLLAARLSLTFSCALIFIKFFLVVACIFSDLVSSPFQVF